MVQLGDDPQKTVGRILYEYKIHNCEILLREEVTTVRRRSSTFRGTSGRASGR